jgi:thioesterase domain-containing protein
MTASVDADGAEAAGAVADVRLERLRAGSADDVLFLVPGLEADPAELAALAFAFAGPQEVHAVAPAPREALPESLDSMQQLAAPMVAAIRRLQPSGPYRLGGYSFGGLLALEMAQQLRAAGETVEALFLIDAFFDERYWPRGTWLRALARRTGRQLLRIARMRPAKAIGELRLRSVRLIQRVMRRRNDGTDPLRADGSDEATMRHRAYFAIGGYRPRFYDGTLTLIASSMDRHFGSDTVQLWAGYADHIRVQRVDGDHLTIMQDPASVSALAGVIDHQLAVTRPNWPGIRPMPGFERPMVLTTMRWFSAARLAHALAESGFAVSACRPKAHPIELVDGLTGQSRLHRLWRSRSLVTAIRRSNPDIILPDDQRALELLRRLHARKQATDPELAALIAHSLGNLEDWSSIESRAGLAERAHELDLCTPETAVIDSADALTTWAAGQTLPIVLKTDGSYGGRGVAVIREAAHLRTAWSKVSSPPSLPRALKRLMFDFEAGPLAAWLRRARPVVNAQQHVEGREAIATVACVDGKVQALVCLEVMQATEQHGPAALVRIIDHPGMAEAARRLVGRFGLSGFCGFDFMITAAGDAQLLELNPRVTPTSHLLVEGDYQRSRTLALFPARPVLNTAPGITMDDVLDLPVRAPSLIHSGELIAARQQRQMTRMTHRLKKKLIAPRY